jgi:hypothetical protein
MSRLSPIPAVPLRDNPQEDSVWKRWLQKLNDKIGGTLTVADGGTGISSYVVGDLIYASATTTLSRLADVATGNVLTSGGVGVAPSYGKVSPLHLHPDIFAFCAAHG